MHRLDIAIICILVVSFIYNLRMGFVRQLFSLGAAILAAVLATSYCGLGHQYLKPYLDAPKFNNILSFAIIFFVVIYLGGLAGKSVNRYIKSIGISPTDRFWGGMLGLIKGGIIASLGLLLIILFADKGPKMIADTRIARFLNPVAYQLSHFLPPALNRQFRSQIYKNRRLTPLEKAILKKDKKKLEQIIEKNL